MVGSVLVCRFGWRGQPADVGNSYWPKKQEKGIPHVVCGCLLTVCCWRLARLVVGAVGGLRGWRFARWAVCGWRFGRLAVCAVGVCAVGVCAAGGLRGGRFTRLAVYAVGGLRGWRFARLAVCAVGGLRLVVCVWWFAFGGLRLAFGGLRLAVYALQFAVGGFRLTIGGLRFALDVVVLQLEFCSSP